MKSIWQDWLSAIQFLTIIPVGRRNFDFNATRALPFFPICGLIIGLAAALVDATASLLWAPPASAMLAAGSMVLLTGALHLDGLADTADGLYGQRTPEKALAIMKDSRLGSMGATAIIGCMAIKWVGIWGIDHQRFWCLILVPAYARASVLWAVKYLPYGRPSGTGHDFFTSPMKWTDFWALPLVVVFSLVLGPAMIILNFGFGLMVVLILKFYRQKIGCITGDMLGALIEAVEAGLFFMLAMGITLG